MRKRAKDQGPVRTVTFRKGRGGIPMRTAVPGNATWADPGRRQAFIEALAGTLNVTTSCRELGLNLRGAYATRLNNPEFAAAWDAALEVGAARLRTAMLRGAAEDFERALDRIAAGEDAPAPDVKGAAVVLRALKAADGKAGSAPPAVAVTTEALKDEIKRRLDALEEELAGAAEGVTGGGEEQRSGQDARGPGEAPR